MEILLPQHHLYAWIRRHYTNIFLNKAVKIIRCVVALAQVWPLLVCFTIPWPWSLLQGNKAGKYAEILS